MGAHMLETTAMALGVCPEVGRSHGARCPFVVALGFYRVGGGRPLSGAPCTNTVGVSVKLSPHVFVLVRPDLHPATCGADRQLARLARRCHGKRARPFFAPTNIAQSEHASNVGTCDAYHTISVVRS